MHTARKIRRAAPAGEEPRVSGRMLDGVSFGALRTAGQPHAATLLTVVVPTRHESGNVEPLVNRLATVLPKKSVEIVFVDDSDDGTPEEILRVAAASARPVKLVHRPSEDRGGGLSGAVVEGIRQSRARYVCVMDGDLQHPPELIGEMVARAVIDDADLVVASRFTSSGDAQSFGRLRAFASWSARMGVRALFPGRLKSISDPMTGFFLIRRAAVDLQALRPCGFKILLEIAARGPALKTAEVPMHFGTRHSGRSKASLREGARFAKQLLTLRFGGFADRFTRFGLVGASGLVVNTVALAVVASLLGLHYVLAALVATQASTLWNFTLTERWVFRDRERDRSMRTRLVAFFALNNIAAGLRVPMLIVLTTSFGMHYLISNVLSLLFFTVVRYAVADSWIWSGKKRRGDHRRYAYDIHGIITVASDVRLPELARFKVAGLEGRPTIAVGIGTPAGPEAAELALDSTEQPHRRIVYREGGGFACEIDTGHRFGGEHGDRVRIVAAPLLRRSPHVLYTNVVEPVLRWSFAQRGYALVHAACIASGDRAFLITALTDTGKTTTCLKALDSQPYGFVSDDLTLLCPDGRVLTYPKPLTISRHTLHAVRTPLLSLPQRAALIIQSRLHSRSGRQFALALFRAGAPMATLNTLTQMIVPPPKYHVDRLVPGVEIANETRLAGLVVIKRGGDVERRLTREEALSTLLANCDDAYGFPPYPVIEGFLHSRNGLDLKAEESAIVREALERVPAMLIESSTMDWHHRLPAWVESIVGVDVPADAPARA